MTQDVTFNHGLFKKNILFFSISIKRKKNEAMYRGK